MIAFIIKNLATIITGAIVLAVCALAVRSLVRGRRSGGGCACGGSCAGCGAEGACGNREAR